MPNNNTQPPQPAGIKLEDILYVLFRHKWKIIFFSAAGIITAGLMYFSTATLYQSEAKLFVRYVQDAKSLGPPGSDTGKSLDFRGDTVINSEAEILTSLDLASSVVDKVGGTEKILPKDVRPRTPMAAAAFIQRNLTVEPPRKSSIISVVFQHPDPEMVQPILRELILSYYTKHANVHKPSGVFDTFLSNQVYTLEFSLRGTEKALRDLKESHNIISIEDTKKDYNVQISKLREELDQTETEYAEQVTSLNEMVRMATDRSPTISSSATSRVEVVDAPVPPAEKVFEYKRVLGQLDMLYRNEEDLLTKFTEQHLSVRNIRESISKTELTKKKLEDEFPRLKENILIAKGPNSSSQTTASAFDLVPARARIAALAAKAGILTNQLERVYQRIRLVDQDEGQITDLQRRKEMEDGKLRYYTSKLEEAQVDDRQTSGKAAPNIGMVQEPSPPVPVSSKLAKRMATASGGGILFGIALAVLIEFFLDQSIKRPGEIESRLHLPLFLSIPRIDQGKNHKRLNASDKKLLAQGSKESSINGATAQPDKESSEEVVPWAKNHALRPFYETLRDRLVGFFEDRNLTHKPKLIAVTACSPGAGVTSIAAALAGSLSETGEGKVLLVDMNLQNGAAHPFFRGNPAKALEEVLENENRQTALVRQNLYMVRGESSDDRLPRILPKRFAGLLPKLKASDYDYIIFDMPSITQTSITPRLAGIMDAVVLVVESEKTDRTVTERALALLAASKAPTVMVLNKTRTYIPRSLHQSFEES